MSLHNENLDFETRFKNSNSIIQLVVTIANYDLRLPPSSAIPNSGKGSAFVIDSKRGILLTNAHVVSNIISVKGLSPKLGTELKMRLISICNEKDLAIVQIFKEDWDILVGDSNPHDLEMEFEDTLNMKPMTKVVAVGYPLGQDNIKFTPGAISGFETLESDASAKDEDDEGDSYSYIQTTAPTNPGNSGGPLIDESNGKVVGVVSAGMPFAQNVGYAVSTRSVWSCLDALMAPIINMNEPPLFAKIQNSLVPKGGYTAADITKINSKNVKIENIIGSFDNTGVLPNIIHPPQIGFTYCRTSKDLCDYYASKIKEKSGDVKGIYITRTFKNSVFQYLKEGSILTSFTCQTSDVEILFGIYDNSGKITCHQYTYKTQPKNGVNIFEQFIESDNKEDLFNLNVIDRKLSFRELIDIVPIGTNITWDFVGETDTEQSKQWGRWNVASSYLPNKKFIPAEERLLHFEPLEFEILGGLCIADLCKNHKVIIPDSQQKYLRGDYKFKRHVIVTFVFSGTSASETRSITMGDILKSINGVEVSTIEDVRNVISKLSKNNLLMIKAVTGDIIAIPVEKAQIEDQNAILAYEIKNYKYRL